MPQATGDFLIDATLVILAAILMYLIYREARGALQGGEFKSRDYFLKKAKKRLGLKGLKENTLQEIEELKNSGRRIDGMIAESKKRYMKGEISFQTYKELELHYEQMRMEAIEKMRALEAIAKSAKSEKGEGNS